MKRFSQVFVDSWKKKSIVPLVKKLDLSFIIVINNDTKYFVLNKLQSKENNKFKERFIPIQYFGTALAFSVTFKGGDECPKFHDIRSLKVQAVLKS